MKTAAILLCAFALACQAPLWAKEEKKTKRELKEEAAKKEAETKKKTDKEKALLHYTAIFSTSVGAPAEGDTADLKSLLNTGTEFICKEVKLEDGKLNAHLTNDKVRLNKSAVNKVIKGNAKYRIEKLSEMEMKDEKDAKDAKKPATAKKDEPKPATPAAPATAPAAPAPAPAAAAAAAPATPAPAPK